MLFVPDFGSGQAWRVGVVCIKIIRFFPLFKTLTRRSERNGKPIGSLTVGGLFANLSQLWNPRYHY